MSKPLGGRGKVAPYETTHVRVPLPVKDKVDKIIEDYRLSIIDGINTQDTVLITFSESKSLAKKLLRAKRSKLETIAKLLTSIYGIEISKDELLD
jgi:hypothetical protein